MAVCVVLGVLPAPGPMFGLGGRVIGTVSHLEVGSQRGVRPRGDVGRGIEFGPGEAAMRKIRERMEQARSDDAVTGRSERGVLEVECGFRYALTDRGTGSRLSW
jgi:hypothetical protein